MLGAAGAALPDVLAHATRTRWRALASGITLPAGVQSSSAVTVVAMGSVNAGLLTLTQAIWVIYGSNIGTTMTGWLVVMPGLQIKACLLEPGARVRPHPRTCSSAARSNGGLRRAV